MNARTRGTTLVELIVTMILLGAALGLIAPVLRWTALERRAAEERQTALEEASNLLEVLTARGWDGATDEAARSLEISEPVEAALRGAELDVEMETTDESPPGKRITVEIRWMGQRTTQTPVRLTAWLFRPAGDEQ